MTKIKLKSFEYTKSVKSLKKIPHGTSDAWSTIHLSRRPSDPIDEFIVCLYIQPNHIEITLPETVTASLNLEELVWLFVELVDVFGSTNSLAILGWLDFFSAVFVDLLVLAGIEKVFSSSMVMAISQNMLLLFCFC